MATRTRQISNKQNQLNIRQDNLTKKDAALFPNAARNPFNNPTRDNYITYPYDYFAGSNAKIFFGDVWVDDIITIQYRAEQNKLPVYGYSSQYYDAILKGQVIVQGSLAIAFKEVGYLNVINNLIKNQQQEAEKAIKAKVGAYNLQAEYDIAPYIPRLNSESVGTPSGYINYSPNGSPNIIRQQQTIEEILANKVVGQGLSRSLLGPDETKNRDFEDFAEILEDTIWGDQNGRPYNQRPLKLLRADEFDYSENGGIHVGRNEYGDSLNILVTFGDINDFRAEHTYIALNDIHFTTSSMIVAQTGEPIAEMYNFFCRDINQALSSDLLNISPIKLSSTVDSEGNPFNEVKAKDISIVETFINNNENIANSVKIQILSYLPREGQWVNNITDLSFMIGDDPLRATQEVSPIDKEDARDISPQQFDSAINANTRKDMQTQEGVTAAIKTAGNKRYTSSLNRGVNATLNTVGPYRSIRFNKYEPIIDQLIRLVEAEFNNPNRTKIDTFNSQYIAKITVNRNASQEDIVMVLQQSIPDTRTYRVIAPTRSQFRSENIITREDLWRNVSLPKTSKPDSDLELFQQNISLRQRRIHEELNLLNNSLELTDDQIDSIRDKELTKLYEKRDVASRKYSESLAADRASEQEGKKSIDDFQSRIRQRRLEEIDSQIEAYESSYDDIKNRQDRNRLKALSESIGPELDTQEALIEANELYQTILQETEEKIKEQEAAEEAREKAADDYKKKIEAERAAAQKRREEEEEKRQAQLEKERQKDEKLRLAQQQQRMDEAEAHYQYLETLNDIKVTQNTFQHMYDRISKGKYGTIDVPLAAAVDISAGGRDFVPAAENLQIIGVNYSNNSLALRSLETGATFGASHIDVSDYVKGQIIERGQGIPLVLEEDSTGYHLHLQQRLNDVATVKDIYRFESYLQDKYLELTGRDIFNGTLSKDQYYYYKQYKITDFTIKDSKSSGGGAGGSF